jgi:hemoglobin
MKKDIELRTDIELLVNTFYDAVKDNPTIGYIFSDVAKVNWDEHLPQMYDFWASILLSDQSFTGNPMRKHVSLSKMTTMSAVEFDAWLLLFSTTVDNLFEGEIAQEAKTRAQNIAGLMLHKIQQSRTEW